MKIKNIFTATSATGWFCWLLALVLPTGCTDEMASGKQEAERQLIEVSGSVQQELVSRVNDQGFVDADEMGVFIVNYEDKQPGKLMAEGNYADNLKFVYEADANRWKPLLPVYWMDAVTPIDVVGYYPFNVQLSQVDAYPIEVQYNQSVAAQNDQLSTYEQSDFLWAKSAGVKPGQPVKLDFHHLMAGVKVVLTEGSGFAEGEWESVTKQVFVAGTARKAVVNLSSGKVQAQGTADKHILMAPESDSYRAVVVPQDLKAGTPLLSLTIDGKSYTHRLDAPMQYRGGLLHQFTVQVTKRTATGTYEVHVAEPQILPWQNDESSHQFESNSYVVVHVAKEGELSAAIKEHQLNPSKIKSLKLTGKLTDADFAYLREQVTNLESLNLKETKLVHCHTYNDYADDGWHWEQGYYDDFLPVKAFANNKKIRRLQLPSGLKYIGSEALSGMELTSPLILPAGLTHILWGAFSHTRLTTSFPPKLEHIGRQAFRSSVLDMELNFPNTVERIQYEAFAYTKGIHGTFNLPPRLKLLEQYAFAGAEFNCDVMHIEFPEQITEIPRHLFSEITNTHGISVSFHDGITDIDEAAFSEVKFTSPFELPAHLLSIGDGAFLKCHFVLDPVLPNSVTSIGIAAFKKSNLTHINFPLNLAVLKGVKENYYNNNGGSFQQTNIREVILSDKLEQIEEAVFQKCTKIRSVQIGKNVQYIDDEAFGYCENLSKLVCMAKDPPLLHYRSFVNVPLDKVQVFVPEESVPLYQAAEGWRDFKHIASYKGFSISSRELTALNKGITSTEILKSKNDWYLESCPDWCEVTPSEGTYHYASTPIKVVVKPLARGAGNREGKVVFRIKDDTETCEISVKQFDSEIAEDTEIVLQEASAGAREIPIFIMGDGFTTADIIDGTYMKTMKQQIDYLFAIEPYKTYREYFTVSTAFVVSKEKGITKSITKVQNRFGSTIAYTSPVGVISDSEKVIDYVLNVSKHVNKENISSGLIVVIANEEVQASATQYCYNGETISTCALSKEQYPYDQRGVIQFEVGGRGFGKLGEENVSHFEFLDLCCCPFCNQMSHFVRCKSKGYLENLSLSGKMEDLPWKHLIFHPKYGHLVDIYEGGFRHLRGIYRSELNSCMRTFIPYYNTISRESIVKRIMKAAGKSYSFDEFVKNDKIELPEGNTFN